MIIAWVPFQSRAAGWKDSLSICACGPEEVQKIMLKATHTSKVSFFCGGGDAKAKRGNNWRCHERHDDSPKCRDKDNWEFSSESLKKVGMTLKCSAQQLKFIECQTDYECG